MKQNTSHFKHLLELNLAMLFISTSGVLGRYVELPVPVTICTRALLAFLLLFLYCKFKGISLKVKKKDWLLILLSGLLMGLHWITYFYALRLSNVAIGMLSLFTYPVITSLLEPVILKSSFQRFHFFLGLLVLLGIYFLVPDFNIHNTKTIAIGVGLLSAVFYALRNIILKSKVKNYHGSMLMVYQTAIIGVFLLPALFYTDIGEISAQWEGILALAFLTTALGHTLFLLTFKHFSITSVSIMSSVQPVYGIILGVVFLSETPKVSTIIGGVLILCSVIIESIRSRK